VASRQSLIVEQYIAAMRTARSFGAHTAETTFYTPLSNLLNSVGEGLKPRVVFVAHPGSRDGNLPDGGLFPVNNRRQTAPLPNQRPERGAVEIKPPGEALTTLAQSEQVGRYLREYGLCLITNYHQFQLVELREGRPSVMESYDLTRTADDLWNLPITALAKRHAETLPDFLARVLTRKVPLEKPKDIAELLASYAREARERAAEHPIVAFSGVKSALQESLGITFEGEKGEHFFRSTLIQTLFYGIFSAWILWRRSPDYSAHNGIFNWRLSAEYLRVAVLRTLFHAVAEPGALNSVQITEVLDHATDALNRVQRDFFTTFREEDAVQYFYEPFLEAFDPELRKELGVWYTPREIVRYMVERVDHLLRTELHEPLGLASPNVQVLDPCCGTGAYLVEVLHRIERTLREHAGDDDALIGADLRRAATTRIFGFEIMPAPFVIAHLQIAQLLEDARASLAATQRAQVFLTNALTGWVPARHPQSTFGFPAFTAERDAAEAVKQADTILVILGNPPYNGYAGIARIEEERDLSDSYRGQVEGLPAPNGQGLNELFVRFFRVAERRITQNRRHRGIFSYISNYSWLDGLSHPTMRHHLRRSFNSVYIDNLHGDRKISEYAPDGRTSETVFAMQGTSVGIKVGTAIATFVKTGEAVPDATISYRDFDDARASERRSHLLSSIHDDGSYAPLSPNSILGIPFKPRTFEVDYLAWPRLIELFPISFPGIQTSRDPLLIDISMEKLEARMRRYFDPRVSMDEFAREEPCAAQNTARFSALETRMTLSERGFRQWQIFRSAYRPYDNRWLYYEPTTKLLDEKRAEYVEQFAPDSPAFLLAQSNRTGFDPPLFTTILATRHLIERGANAFPLKATTTGLFQQERRANLSTSAEGYLASIRSSEPSLFFHALAIMHTPRYRAENAGALLGDWPRIPLPATLDLLTRSATLGRRLAELLDPESDIQLAAEWSFLAKLSLPAELPEGTPDRDRRNAARFALTAGWGGRGQGETVMPRRGNAPERDWTSAELDRLTTLAASQNLTRDDALTFLGPRCVDVYLNGEASWVAVPINVWEYTLGGYQVLKKWLSYREEPLLGRPLHEDEARYFTQVVRRIAAILLLGPALDASYGAIIPTASGLPNQER
jgi:Type ISP C-terminal specificity domain/N-6 DNA Methylase